MFEFKSNVVYKENPIAFAVDMDTYIIYLSNSGHSKIVRDFQLNTTHYDMYGGWIYPKEKKISLSSGTLRGLNKKYFSEIGNAINNELKSYFRIV